MKNSKFNEVMRYTGLVLVVVFFVSHIFIKDLDLTLLIIPAIMMGLDITNLFKK